MRSAHKTPDSPARARWAGRVDAVRVLVVLALIGLVVALAVDNRQEVPVGWLFGDGDLPMYQMFVATFVVGIVTGLVIRSRHTGR